MVTIRIVATTGTGPTDVAAFDSALAAVAAENYNLVCLSSVIPADATVNHVDDLADLGSVGDRLHVVQARALTRPAKSGSAGITWARTDDGQGIFYEASAVGPEASEEVAEELDVGIEHGLALRSWTASHRDTQQVTIEPGEEEHGCALVLAAFGSADRPW